MRSAHQGKVALAPAAVFAVVALVGSIVQAAPSGAIFTTLEDGSSVNANIYDAKEDVYLDGGPGPNAPQTAAGLDDGNYYFQVTDPSGKTLLSTDPVLCREVRVEDGIIVEYVSAGRNYTVRNRVVDCNEDGKSNGLHDTGTDADHGAVTVQLMPYDDTPNRGGVYKAWMTPTEDFDGDNTSVDNPCGSGCFHGFVPAHSKTDNFKVKTRGQFVAPTLTVQKFEDLDGDGVWDTGEPEIGVDRMIDSGGWPVSVTDPNSIASNGFSPYFYYPGFAGDYVVTEDPVDGWGQTALYVDGVSLTVSSTATVDVDYRSGETHNVIFGNFECFSVSGTKVNDRDGDGLWDDGEVTLAGWTIQLWRNGALYATTTTGSDGSYSFEVCAGGSYQVKEVNQDGWTQTGTLSYSFTGASGTNRTGKDFFNFGHFRVSGSKVNDLNGNGVWDSGEPTLSGWTIQLWRNGALDATTTTGSDGSFSFTVTQPGSYEVREVTQSGWVAVTSTSFSFVAASGENHTGLNFLNFKEGSICGSKFYDVNHDGSWNAPEAGLANWTIELYKDGTLVATATTDAGGSYCFSGLLWGTYEVREVQKNASDESHVWSQTFPSGDGDWDITMTSGLAVEDADFGNVCEFTEGLTWGYWKTHTGSGAPARDAAYDDLPTNPLAIDLATPDSDFEIDSDAEADWLFDGAGSGESPNCSGDCRSLVRAQLLALWMNTLAFAGMADEVYMYAGDVYSGMTVAEIIAEAQNLLGNSSVTDLTGIQETLDRINNNGHAADGSHVLVCAKADL